MRCIIEREARPRLSFYRTEKREDEAGEERKEWKEK
jgi:hypothetical protein